MNFKDMVFTEIKSQLKSKVFYAFIVVVLLNLLTNYNTDISRLDPIEKGSFYGFTSTSEESDILYRGYELLSLAYLDNQVIRYVPLASYKKLNDNQTKELGDFLAKMAPDKDILSVRKDDFVISANEMFDFMEKLDQELGGKTYFADKEYFHNRPTTYEEALEKNDKIKSQDQFTRAYARLFSDYNGISAAQFSVFIVVISLFYDIRSGKRDMHYTMDTRSANYIYAKFTGLLICIMGVFIISALFETIIFVISALQNGQSIDLLAFVWTTFIWITPTVMFSIALPLLIYTAFNKFSLALSSGLFISTYMIMTTELSADYDFSRLIIRFNAIEAYEQFEPFVNAILLNRAFYITLSLIMLFISSYIWKRRKSSVLEALNT